MNFENETLLELESKNLDRYFIELYGSKEEILTMQKERYRSLIEEHIKTFGEDELEIFSSPGRTEIGGNHTDHNRGKVLGASVCLDCIGVASKNQHNIIRIHDTTYNEDFSININESQRVIGEKGSIALVRGIVSGFLKYGFKVGGFNISLSSNVISAAGVSSSAAFEMLICKVMDNFYNTQMTKVNYATIGKYSENKFWDKQSGLLDQMTCAIGGMVAIDFIDEGNPQIKNIDFDFSGQNYDLLLVNTGGNHADLSEEYSQVPKEMKEAANFLGGEVLRDIPYERFMENIEQIRIKAGDRAVLRGLHFYEENNRVDMQVEALNNKKFDEFLKLITASGNSSWKWLQNCYCNCEPSKQGVTFYLALTEIFINHKKAGACRVHGGGFAGVIAVYLPQNITAEYISYIEKITQCKSIYKMSIRNYGVVSMKEIKEMI